MRPLQKRIRVLLTVFGLLALVLLGVGLLRAKGGGREVVVGAKSCSEQLILAEICAQLLERQTDLAVVRRFSLEGTAIAFHALLSGNIDLYCEYTGTGLLEILHEPCQQDPAAIYERVSSVFATKYGLSWLSAFGFDNSYAFAMQKEVAEKRGIRTLSQLFSQPLLHIAVDPEFIARAEFEELQRAYGIAFSPPPLLMDQTLLYLSLMAGAIDAISVFSTDGVLPSYPLILLDDDLHAFPAYEAAPLVRTEVLKRYPEIGIVLKLLSGKISTSTMQELNAKVDGEGKSPALVAHHFLESLEL